MSERLNAELFVLTCSSGRATRYLLLTLRTLKVLYKNSPRTVFAQNPSIVLSALILMLRPIFGYQAVIDQHNSGLFPLEGRSRVLNFIADRIVKHADLLFVSNGRLKTHVESIGGTAVVLPDPLPIFGASRFVPVSKERPLEILFICTWSADEPYLEVLEAARQVDPRKFRIAITGKYDGKINPSKMPESVSLLGFVADSIYIENLIRSDAVIVLTTREDCLNCGAYEAVSMGKPGILSNTAALREYFCKGFVYTRREPSSILLSLNELYDNYEEMATEVIKLREKLSSSYPSCLAQAEHALGG